MDRTSNKSSIHLQSNKHTTPKLSKTSIGAVTEYQAVINLMNEGYIVATATEPHSLFDLVAVHPTTGKIRLIDVKTKSFRKNNNYEICRTLNEKQKKLGVELLIIDMRKDD